MRSVPAIGRVGMAEADRRAVDDYGITVLQMMEHAGRAVADVTVDRFGGRPVVVLAGPGGNGGGGLCAARHLVNRGVAVTVVRSSDRTGPEAAHHLATLAAMGLEPEDAPPAGDPVVIDAMVGYSADGPLRGRAAQLAGWSAGREVVALDLPSGVDADAGPTAGSVTATVTVTLALPKPGLAAPGGDLVLADLGLPAGLWGGLVEAVPADLFADGHLVPLTATSSGFSATSS